MQKGEKRLTVNRFREEKKCDHKDFMYKLKGGKALIIMTENL